MVRNWWQNFADEDWSFLASGLMPLTEMASLAVQGSITLRQKTDTSFIAGFVLGGLCNEH